MPTNIQMLEHEMHDRLAAKNVEIANIRAELAAAKQRIAELRGLLAYGTDTSAYRRIRARAEKSEAELDISREAIRMIQSALLSQAAETERAEAQRDAMREALRKIEQETIDYVAVRIARAAQAPSLAGREG